MSPADIALKIQRRRYAQPATWEIYVHHLVREADGRSPGFTELREAFLHDGHVCMAFTRHGRSLDETLRRGPLSVVRVREITRQLLGALGRLHAHGYGHTDVKPGNILYDSRTRDARLCDLGGARQRISRGANLCTRVYRPPEVILGASVGPSLDLWCLGCTVFEMLTSRELFNPRRAAAKKYVEFSDPSAALPLAPSVEEENQAWKTEQIPRGTIIEGKYELIKELGSGTFGTVWAARQLHPRPLSKDNDAIWAHAEAADAVRSRSSAQERADRVWRSEKGADDLIDLTLNYEQVLEMTALCGPLPPTLIAAGKFRSSYFDSDYALRFRPEVRRVSLRERLRRGSTLRGTALDEAADFLRVLLAADPLRRPTPEQALGHGWLK